MATNFDGVDAETPASAARSRSRRKHKRKPVMSLGMRWSIVGLSSVLAVGLCFEICAKIAQPYEMQRDESVQIHQLSAQLASENAANADLTRQAAYLQRPDGVENAARGQGFLRPGEVSIEIDPKSMQPAPAQSSPSGISGMFQRAFHNFIH